MRTLTRQKLQSLRTLSRRRNPVDAPEGVPQATWRGQLERGQTEIRDALRTLRTTLAEKGVSEDLLPTPLDIKKQAEAAGVILASSQYAELASQSRLLTPSDAVAEEVLGLSSGGIFEKAVADSSAKSLAKTAKNAMASRLNVMREAALKKRSSATAAVRAAQEAELEALLESLDEQQQEEAEVEERISREDVKALAAALKADEAGGEDDEEEEEVVEEAPKKRRSGGGKGRARTRAAKEVVEEEVDEEEELPVFRGSVSDKGERLGGYANFLTRIRKTAANDPSYRPPTEALRKETAQDILLYLLKDGTTQVWIKGALTESFTGSRGRGSWMVAKGYAQQWLEQTGKTGSIKKSRMGTRVVFSTEEEPDRMKVLVQSYAERKAPAQKVPSFDTVVAQLMGEGKKKPNPSVRELPFRNPTSEHISKQLEAAFRLSNPGFSVAQGNQMPASAMLRNRKKLPVPDYIAKTPRKAGERISAIGVKGKWPIGDLFHARVAAIYIKSPAHASRREKVLRALETHYPQYDWKGFVAQPATLRQLKTRSGVQMEERPKIAEGNLPARAASVTEADKKRQRDTLRGLLESNRILRTEYDDGIGFVREGRGAAFIEYLLKGIYGGEPVGRRKVANPMHPSEKARLLAAVQHWYRNGQIDEHEFRTATLAIERGNDGVMVLFPTLRSKRTGRE